jgi:hypothetical protein
LPQDFAKFFSSRGHVALCGAGNADRRHLLRTREWAVEQTFASDEVQENIQGTWTLETVTVDGKAMPPVTMLYIFTGEMLIVRPEASKEQKATFTLDNNV